MAQPHKLSQSAERAQGFKGRTCPLSLSSGTSGDPAVQFHPNPVALPGLWMALAVAGKPEVVFQVPDE